MIPIVYRDVDSYSVPRLIVYLAYLTYLGSLSTIRIYISVHYRNWSLVPTERPLQGKIEIIRYCININEKIISLFIAKAIILHIKV